MLLTHITKQKFIVGVGIIFCMLLAAFLAVEVARGEHPAGGESECCAFIHLDSAGPGDWSLIQL